MKAEDKNTETEARVTAILYDTDLCNEAGRSQISLREGRGGDLVLCAAWRWPR